MEPIAIQYRWGFFFESERERKKCKNHDHITDQRRGKEKYVSIAQVEENEAKSVLQQFEKEINLFLIGLALVLLFSLFQISSAMIF
jgi:hypothetical protein